MVYYENDSINEESHYLMGVLDSVYKHWGKNGKLMIKGNYFLGQKVGIWRYYFPNGKKQAIEIFTEQHELIPKLELLTEKLFV